MCYNNNNNNNNKMTIMCYYYYYFYYFYYYCYLIRYTLSNAGSKLDEKEPPYSFPLPKPSQKYIDSMSTIIMITCYAVIGARRHCEQPAPQRAPRRL